MKTIADLAKAAEIPPRDYFYLIGNGDHTGIKDAVEGKLIVPPVVPEAVAKLIQACLNRGFASL